MTALIIFNTNSSIFYAQKIKFLSNEHFKPIFNEHEGQN